LSWTGRIRLRFHMQWGLLYGLALFCVFFFC
jgi:hypothetical protein